jgi:hypothetical protein
MGRFEKNDVVGAGGQGRAVEQRNNATGGNVAVVQQMMSGSKQGSKQGQGSGTQLPLHPRLHLTSEQGHTTGEQGRGTQQ